MLLPIELLCCNERQKKHLLHVIMHLLIRGSEGNKASPKRLEQARSYIKGEQNFVFQGARDLAPVYIQDQRVSENYRSHFYFRLKS